MLSRTEAISTALPRLGTCTSPASSVHSPSVAYGEGTLKGMGHAGGPQQHLPPLTDYADGMLTPRMHGPGVPPIPSYSPYGSNSNNQEPPKDADGGALMLHPGGSNSSSPISPSSFVVDDSISNPASLSPPRSSSSSSSKKSSSSSSNSNIRISSRRFVLPPFV